MISKIMVGNVLIDIRFGIRLGPGVRAGIGPIGEQEIHAVPRSLLALLGERPTSHDQIRAGVSVSLSFVDRRRGGEPACGLLGTTGGKQRLGIGVPKTGGPRRGRRLGRGQIPQQHDGGLRLTEVPAGPGDDDEHLRPSGRIKLVDLRIPQVGDGTLRPAQPPFAVRHQRQVVRGTVHPTSGPKFHQGRRVLPRVVSRDTDRLAHRGQAWHSIGGGAGVGKRAGGIVVEQQGGCDEMAGDRVGE